jgi:hypothetical protein
MSKTNRLDKPFKYNLHKITDKLYCVEMPCGYDLAMLFLRYQEYYESPNPNVKGKAFDLFEYMRWYATTNTRRYNKDSYKSFSYPIDFCGFNIPSYAITDTLINNEYSGHLNIYDDLMYEIYYRITQDMGINQHSDPNNKFYLIGTQKMRSSTMKHEIAHGLFYLNDTYREKCLMLINEHLDKDQIKAFKKILKEYHYSADVMLDEIQAYTSTGEFAHGFPTVNMEPFKKHFNKYYKQLKSHKI